MTPAIALTLALFVGAEVLDPRELDDELPDLADRIELLRDCPRLADATRFHHVHCLLLVYEPAWQQARAGVLERLHHADAYGLLARHCERVVTVLYALQDAQDEFSTVLTRRLRLKDARDAMDDDDWNQGIRP